MVFKILVYKIVFKIFKLSVYSKDVKFISSLYKTILKTTVIIIRNQTSSSVKSIIYGTGLWFFFTFSFSFRHVHFTLYLSNCEHTEKVWAQIAFNTNKIVQQQRPDKFDGTQCMGCTFRNIWTRVKKHNILQKNDNKSLFA